MVYKDGIAKLDIKDNTTLWGCEVRVSKSRDRIIAIKPYKGLLINKRFHPYNKEGKIKREAVDLLHRKYADTREECISMYNGLIDESKEQLKKIHSNLGYVKVNQYYKEDFYD